MTEGELSPGLDPELAGILAIVAAGRGDSRDAASFEAARVDFKALTVGMRDDSLMDPVDSVSDIEVPGGAGALRARVYRPEIAGPVPTVAFFHGGGFVLGDLDTHEATARTLARRCEVVVVSVDYRLAPEDPFPAAVEDAVAAARWIASSAASLGGDTRIAVAGDSAGGNLAAVVAQELRAEFELAGQLLIYPSIDVFTNHRSMVDNGVGYFLETSSLMLSRDAYLADVDRTAAASDPRICPNRGELAGLAPAVVVTAEFDPLRDTGNAYAASLAAAGVAVTHRTFPGLVHGFAGMTTYSRAAAAAWVETCDLFRDVVRGVSR